MYGGDEAQSTRIHLNYSLQVYYSIIVDYSILVDYSLNVCEYSAPHPHGTLYNVEYTRVTLYVVHSYVVYGCPVSSTVVLYLVQLSGI